MPIISSDSAMLRRGTFSKLMGMAPESTAAMVNGVCMGQFKVGSPDA